MIESKQFEPLVSIIIPVYNGSDYLADAINSALNQTYKNIEVVVINDGSNDNGKTDTIANSYSNKIRYFDKINGGVASALNLGIEKMQGDYFSWLSHDDMYSPNKVKKQIDIIRQLENRKTILYSGYKLITPNASVRGAFNPKLYYPKEKLNHPLFPLFNGIVNGCTLLIHKSHFNRVGVFDDRLESTQDFDLWFRMFRGNEIRYCNSLEVKTRIHENQGSKKIADHDKNCSKLWIHMIESLSDDEMIEISGSINGFYVDTYNFLCGHTNYLEAIHYLKDKISIISNHRNLISNISPKMIINKFILLFYKLKYDGVKITLYKIKKMFIRREQ